MAWFEVSLYYRTHLWLTVAVVGCLHVTINLFGFSFSRSFTSCSPIPLLPPVNKIFLGFMVTRSKCLNIAGTQWEIFAVNLEHQRWFPRCTPSSCIILDECLAFEEISLLGERWKSWSCDFLFRLWLWFFSTFSWFIQLQSRSNMHWPCGRMTTMIKISLPLEHRTSTYCLFIYCLHNFRNGRQKNDKLAANQQV